MTTYIWVAIIVALCLVLFFVTLELLRQKRARRENAEDYLASRERYNATKALLDKAASISRSQTRYEISIVDWGADFTGEDGVLPRWRWMVWDADRELKKVFENDLGLRQVGIDTPFMLGNEPTYRAAFEASMIFIETHKYPLDVIMWDPYNSSVVIP
jgi:hypothetical protein